MDKKTACDVIDRTITKVNRPITPEWLIRLLSVKGKVDLSSRMGGKIREYVRDYIRENLEDYIAGGVIYPEVISRKVFIAKDSGLRGMSDVWRKLIWQTYSNGLSFGTRIILPGVYVSGMTMRLGTYHYLDVGYTSSAIVRAWSSYFDDSDITNFTSTLDCRRIGYSNIYRCAKDWNKADAPCLDAVAITFLSSDSVMVHANYRISNLNRMMLVDFFLLHKFLRLVLPLEVLASVRITCYFNSLALDLDMLGWLVNIPGFNELIVKHRVRGKTGFRRVDLPKEFARKKKIRDFGVNTFVYNHYGLEKLYGKVYHPKITHC